MEGMETLVDLKILSIQVCWPLAPVGRSILSVISGKSHQRDRRIGKTDCLGGAICGRQWSHIHEVGKARLIYYFLVYFIPNPQGFGKQQPSNH